MLSTCFLLGKCTTQWMQRPLPQQPRSLARWPESLCELFFCVTHYLHKICTTIQRWTSPRCSYKIGGLWLSSLLPTQYLSKLYVILILMHETLGARSTVTYKSRYIMMSLRLLRRKKNVRPNLSQSSVKTIMLYK